MKNFIMLLVVGALAVATGFARGKDSSSGAGCQMDCCQHHSQAVEKQAAEGAHNHAAMSAKTSAPAPRREVGAVARTQARFGRIQPVQETATPAPNTQVVASADTNCSMPDCCKH
jgi:type IV secretory pathway TrbL component